VDLERKEIIPDILKIFLEKRNSNPSKKIIYCSLGTVADIHLGKTIGGKSSLKTEFVNKILQVAANNPNYYFIISSGDDLNKELDGQIFTDNAMVLNFAPQVFILKRADLFVTHGGGNSIFEGIYTETPMLIFPLNNEWDQNGTAARAVYHKVGIKGDIKDAVEKMEEQIYKLLADKAYKVAVSEMANTMKQKYTDAYFSDQLDKIIAFKSTV
jgi:UDP:flavonoid glycosyltransferase YjiC (YdhE family)